MKVKVAVVQAESEWGEEEYKNAFQCMEYLEEAAATGAKIIALPEGYPGPSHGPMDSAGKLPKPPIQMVCDKAKELKVYVAASNVEENTKIPGTYFLSQKLISPKGEIIANHRRVQPDEPDLNEYLFNGKRDMVPGDDVTVVDTDYGKVGLLICSELWVPELVRMEMLMGAEIIICPRNGFHHVRPNDCMETWYAMCHARAAENMMYVMLTQNIFVKGYRTYGYANIAGPEHIIAKRTEPGVLAAELDMDRLRSLRKHYYTWDFLGTGMPPDLEPPLGCRPGQHVLRRPEVYGRLLQPLPTDYDYWYFLKKGKQPR